ncbi:unnamed protein product [Lymnaea stagnalis]|uniref:Apextrin C-terminal domain-containing protein n=1 Tax=Lymnaea stagnalis TaxID=6523 RepID=A0AAV2HDQ4_LYMST
MKYKNKMACNAVRVLAAFLSLTAYCHGFTLTATPDHIEIDQTQNVVLECKFGGSSNSDLVEINRVRIDKHVNGAWTLVAQIVDVNNQISSVPSVTATGLIGAPRDTYLRVAWKLATADTPGEYRCEQLGLNGAQNFVSERTDAIVIGDNSAITATINLLVKKQTLALQNSFDQYKKETSQELTDILNIIRINQISELQAFNNISAQLASIVQKQNSLDARITALEGGSVVAPTSAPVTTSAPGATAAPGNQQWPGGSYGLYQPRSGCPANTSDATWVSGYRRHHTEPINNIDHVSDGGNMAIPIFEEVGTEYYFNQRFCMVPSPANGPAWPSGSYCINRKGGSCPAGFNSGYIEIDDYSNSQDVVSGSVPDGAYGTTSIIYYCCRNDGAVSDPITLPTGSSFYLYRYSTQCQRVSGMLEQQEYIFIDTASANNLDKYENQWHPSGSLNDVRIVLCYYRPI